MKAIFLLMALAFSKALYPPPNYNSIVKPSITYFKPEHEQPGESYSSLPPKVPTYTKPPSHLYFTLSSAVPSFLYSTSTQAPSHSYQSPSSSTFSVALPSPTISTSYGYIIPGVTPASQQHSSSVAPGHHGTLLQVHNPASVQQIIQHQPINSVHLPTSLNSSQAGLYTAASSPISQHDIQHTPLAPAPVHVTSHLEQNQTVSPPVKTEYEYVIPNFVSTSGNRTSTVLSSTSGSEVHEDVPVLKYGVPHAKPPQSVNPQIGINYQYIIPANTSTDVASVSKNKGSHTYIIPGSQHGVNTHYTTVVAVASQNETVTVHSPHPAYNIPHVSATPACEYKESNVKHQEAVNPPVRSQYEYVIPNIASVSIAPATTTQLPVVPLSIPEYDVGHIHSETPFTGYGVPHIGQHQAVNLPVKIDYKHDVPTNFPTVALPVSGYDVIHSPKLPATQNSVSHIEQHYSTAGPLLHTYYQYTIPKTAVPSNGPTPAVATSAPEHNVLNSEAPAFHYGLSYAGQQQTSSLPIKTEYEYVIPNSTPTPIAPSSENRIATSFSTTPEHNVYHHPEAATPKYEAPHVKQPQSTNPPIKINYEYVIPTNSPSTMAPVSEYNHPQPYKITTPEYGVPSITIESIPPNRFGCGVPHIIPQQPINSPVIHNPMLAVTTPSELSDVFPPSLDDYVPHVQQPVSPPVITNYEYVIPIHTSAPIASVPVPEHEELHIPSSEYSTSQQHVTNHPTQSNNQYVVSQTATSSSNYGASNKSETIPIQKSYEYSIPNKSILAGTTQENGPVTSELKTDHGNLHISTTSSKYETSNPHVTCQPIQANSQYVISQHTTTSNPSATTIPDAPSTQYGIPNKAEAPVEVTIPIETSYEYSIPNQSVTASTSQEHEAPTVVSQPVILPVPIGDLLRIPTLSLKYNAVKSHLNNQPLQTNNQYVIPQLARDPPPTNYNSASSISEAPNTEYGVPNKAETSSEVKIPIETSYEYNIQSHSVQANPSQEYGTPTVTYVPAFEHGGLHFPAPSSEHGASQQHVISQFDPTTASSNPTSSFSKVPNTEHDVPNITDAPAKVKVPTEFSYEYGIPSQSVPDILSQEYGTSTMSTPSTLLLHAEYGVPH